MSKHKDGVFISCVTGFHLHTFPNKAFVGELLNLPFDHPKWSIVSWKHTKTTPSGKEGSYNYLVPRHHTVCVVPTFNPNHLIDEESAYDQPLTDFSVLTDKVDAYAYRSIQGYHGTLYSGTRYTPFDAVKIGVKRVCAEQLIITDSKSVMREILGL